jgi:hypothetical protein
MKCNKVVERDRPKLFVITTPVFFFLPATNVLTEQHCKKSAIANALTRFIDQRIQEQLSPYQQRHADLARRNDPARRPMH